MLRVLDGDRDLLHIVVWKNMCEQKLWSSSRAVSSQSEGCGFDPHSILDGSGAKAMHGSISAPNSNSSQKIRKIQVAKWGTLKFVLILCVTWPSQKLSKRDMVSISSTFYEQLFLRADSICVKRLTTWLSFLHFWDLHTQKLLVKCWWNQPRGSIQ